MHTEIKTHTYPNGDLQRVQLVRWEDWSKLDFLRLPPADGALDCFADIYRNFLVPAAPFLFGHMVMFRIPDDITADFPAETGKFGTVADPLTAATAALRAGVRVIRGKPVFSSPEAESFWQALEQRGCIRIVSGLLPVTTFIPVNRFPGYLSDTAPDAPLKVNAPFFIMDRFDCATVYDQVGTPFGLCVKDGAVFSPPLYNREALLVRTDGRVSVENLDIRYLTVHIGGRAYTHSVNARFFTRPHRTRTPGGCTCAVIIGNRVAAVRRGSVPIPASGFVLCTREDTSIHPGDPVTFSGLEDVRFGIQVGNSILRNGVKTDRFRSRFYNIRHLEPVPYPPSLYPMDFSHARAARIALGADKEGRPMLLWAEGAAKFGYVPGKGSCGASLAELAELCADAGMENAVNLDGGGSAQILLRNRRALQISDRSAADHTEAERPIPLGLILRE